MTQPTSYQTRWDLLSARVGDADATLNSALLGALNAYQRRVGCLPGGFDGEEWEDVYRDALKAYRASAA